MDKAKARTRAELRAVVTNSLNKRDPVGGCVKCIVMFFIDLALAIALWFTFAFVGAAYWKWFIASQFDVMLLTMAQVFGIGITFAILKTFTWSSLNVETKDNMRQDVWQATQIGGKILALWISWPCGWLIQWFMF